MGAPLQSPLTGYALLAFHRLVTIPTHNQTVPCRYLPAQASQKLVCPVR